MSQKYTPIWDDWLTVTRELNAAEKGRLIDAIVAYDNSGSWQELIQGNERYVFPGYQVRLDLWKGLTETRARAAKGNKTEQNETKPNKTEQNEANKSKNDKVKVKVKVKDIYDDDDTRAREDTVFGAVDVDPLILKAQRELNGLTDTHYRELGEYRDELTDEVVSHAIDNAVGNGVRNWNYVAAILREYTKNHVHSIGEAKALDEKRKAEQPSKPAKTVRAQQYAQREYNENELESKLGVNDIFAADWKGAD